MDLFGNFSQNFIVFGSLTVIYLKGIQPNLINKKTSNHINIINNTIDWYKNYYEKKIVKTDDQIENFIQDAQKNKISWALDVT